MRAKQGRVVRKGEHQRSTVLSGMPKKARLQDSHLINTRRIIATFRPEQWNEADSDAKASATPKQVPFYDDLLPMHVQTSEIP